MAMRQPLRQWVEEIRRLDPHNLEHWEWIPDPIIPGFRFQMNPDGRRFIFYAFPVASFSNNFLLSPAEPSFDSLLGHNTHVIDYAIGGGSKVPIICRHHGRQDHETIQLVRGTAGKFALYHSIRLATGKAPFSA